MACRHPARAGYAFCGQCGQAVDVPRCVCGFIGAAMDRYCGRCGKDLQAAGFAAGPEATQAAPGRGLPSLARLAAQAQADRGIGAPVRKVSVKQDEIRQLVAARRRKG